MCFGTKASHKSSLPPSALRTLAANYGTKVRLEINDVFIGHGGAGAVGAASSPVIIFYAQSPISPRRLLHDERRCRGVLERVGGALDGDGVRPRRCTWPGLSRRLAATAANQEAGQAEAAEREAQASLAPRK